MYFTKPHNGNRPNCTPCFLSTKFHSLLEPLDHKNSLLLHNGRVNKAYMSRLMTKPTKWHVRPAKTQISLGIRQVRSESSQSAWRNTGSLPTHWAHSEDSDQTGRLSRLFWVFARRTVILLVLSWGLDGWMDELGFYVPSTVFQSFRDDGRVNMNGSVQWSAV